MKENILEISEITYSREMYEAKPRPFVSAFIYIFLAIILGLITWTYFSELDIVSRGNGIVRPNEHISTLKVQYTGKLTEVNVREGLMVEEGDVLYSVEHEDLLLQQSELEDNIEDINAIIISLKSYETSINNEEETFEQASKYNGIYQIKFKNYLANLDYLNYQKETTKLQLAKNNQTAIISQQLERLRNDLILMNSLKQSIYQGKNLLSDSKYSAQYEDYFFKIQQHETELSYLEESLDKSLALFEAGIIAENEYETEKYNYESKVLAFEQYKINYLSDLEDSITQVTNSIAQYEAQYQTEQVTRLLLSNAEENGDSEIQKYYLDTLVAVQDEIKNYEEQLETYITNLDSISLQINQAMIKAPVSGRINLLSKVAKGDYVSLGSELATIIPEDEYSYTVDIALPNKEVAGIEIGDLIKFQFSALPYKEYGDFTGTVTNISTDIKNDASGGSYYLVEAKLDDAQVISYKGEIRDIKVGMTCEAFIITEQKKILYWLLEKINLRD